MENHSWMKYLHAYWGKDDFVIKLNRNLLLGDSKIVADINANTFEILCKDIPVRIHKIITDGIIDSRN